MKAYKLIDSPEKWQNAAPYPGRHCAITAISLAYGWDNDAYRSKRNLILQHIGDTWSEVTEWNDASDWETVYGTLKELNI